MTSNVQRQEASPKGHLPLSGPSHRPEKPRSDGAGPAERLSAGSWVGAASLPGEESDAAMPSLLEANAHGCSFLWGNGCRCVEEASRSCAIFVDVAGTRSRTYQIQEAQNIYGLTQIMSPNAKGVFDMLQTPFLRKPANTC